MKKGNAQQRRPLQVTRCRLVFLGYFEIQLEGREAADNDVLVQTGRQRRRRRLHQIKRPERHSVANWPAKGKEPPVRKPGAETINMKNKSWTLIQYSRSLASLPALRGSHPAQ